MVYGQHSLASSQSGLGGELAHSTKQASILNRPSNVWLIAITCVEAVREGAAADLIRCAMDGACLEQCAHNVPAVAKAHYAA